MSLPWSRWACQLWAVCPYLGPGEHVSYGQCVLTLVQVSMSAMGSVSLPWSRWACQLWAVCPYLGPGEHVSYGQCVLTLVQVSMSAMGSVSLPWSRWACQLWAVPSSAVPCSAHSSSPEQSSPCPSTSTHTAIELRVDGWTVLSAYTPWSITVATLTSATTLPWPLSGHTHTP